MFAGKKWAAAIGLLVIVSMVLMSCAPAPTPVTVVETVVVKEKVEVPKEVVKEVVKTVEVPKEVVKEVEVVVTATPEPVPVEDQLTIYHWWTAGGERQAMDKIFECSARRIPLPRSWTTPLPGVAALR